MASDRKGKRGSAGRIPNNSKADELSSRHQRTPPTRHLLPRPRVFSRPGGRPDGDGSRSRWKECDAEASAERKGTSTTGERVVQDCSQRGGGQGRGVMKGRPGEGKQAEGCPAEAVKPSGRRGEQAEGCPAEALKPSGRRGKKAEGCPAEALKPSGRQGENKQKGAPLRPQRQGGDERRTAPRRGATPQQKRTTTLATTTREPNRAPALKCS